MKLDRRHKWRPLRRGKFTTRYVCYICGKLGSELHDFAGKMSEVFKRAYSGPIRRSIMAEDPKLRDFFKGNF